MSGHLLTARHDLASLFQSMAEEVARKSDERTGIAGELRGTAPHTRPGIAHPMVAAAAAVARRVSQGRIPAAPVPTAAAGPAEAIERCAELAFRLLEARIFHHADAQQIEDELRFSSCDPEWVEAIARYVEYFGIDGKKRPIPYVRHQSLDDFVLPALPPGARVALVGDWGTGTAEARRVLAQVASHRPDALVHLGDVYYSGTPEENQSWFLALLDEVLARAVRPIPVYTLSGNHDMYSGGVGYYGILPHLNPSPPYAPDQAQPASYFSLRTTDGAWQLLAMDTGLHDHDPFQVDRDVTFLEPGEEEWHEDKVRRFGAAGGRTILLSHHPLFSAFAAIGDYRSRPLEERAVDPRLLASYQRFAAAGEIAAWFWGHEHNLEIYQPYRGLARGRCIGHGAIPTFVADSPYRPLPDLGDDPPQLVTGDDGRPLELAVVDQVYAHGFVMLELGADRTATASYYQETSEQPMWVERF
jgi:hypothetical protein